MTMSIPTRLKAAAGVSLLSLLVACAPAAPSGNNASGPAAACSIPEPSTATTVNILAFSAPAIDPFTNSMTNVCPDLKNLDVRHTPVDFNAQLEKAKLALSSTTDSPYDLVEVYDSTLVEYAAKGWLTPLDDLVAKYKVDYVPQSLWKEFSYDGHIYGIPNQQNAQILIYRKDVFEKAGIKPPTTYAEMIQASKQIKEKASDLVKYPVAMAWGADEAITNGFHDSLVGHGGEWFKGDKAGFNSPDGVKALQDMKELYSYMPPEATTWGNGDVMTAMQQGQVGMTVIWASRATPILDASASRVADKVAFAPAPLGVTGGKPASQWSQDGFALAKNSKVDKDLLFQIALATLDTKVQTEAAKVALVSRTSVVDDPAAAQPHWPATLDTIKAGAESLPHKAAMQDVLAAVRPHLADALAGKTSAQDALSAAEADANKAIK